MDYETFKQEMTEDLKQRLYERGIKDVEMSFHNVEKANQHYESLTVRQEGSNVGVNFNIENAFAEYEHTGDYAGVLAESTHAIMQGLENVPSVDTSELTNDMIDHMGVTHEQLKADALENAPEIRPAVIQGMSEVMREMMGPEAFEMFGLPEEQEEMMYVATVPDKNSGAGVLAYQDFMDQAAEKLGGDFYILPSSIHEILLVPDNGDKAADDLRDMVREVNATQVSPEEKLTDNVYHYDSKEHIFELAEKFEARQQEKAEAQIDEKSEEHGSVLKDLKDKQKEVAAKPPVKDAAEKAAKAKGGEAL